MRTFQLIVTIISVLMVLGMFGFNIWINANFSKGLKIPECFMPITIITTILVLVMAITVFIKK